MAISTSLANRVLSIPMGPHLSLEDAGKVAESRTRCRARLNRAMASPIFRKLRLAEIEDTIQRLRRHKPSGTLLEIGAGTGWQSKALAEAGYEVDAIDLPADAGISDHARTREWPIRNYDGARLPFGAGTFDIIYSSNVLEHVEDLDTLTVEMRRVLRRDGLALHLLPNPVWRSLSLLTHYPAQAIDAVRWARRKPGSADGNSAQTEGTRRSYLGKAMRRLLPHAHGARGTAVGELRRFSRSSWDAISTAPVGTWSNMPTMDCWRPATICSGAHSRCGPAPFLAKRSAVSPTSIWSSQGRSRDSEPGLL